VGGGGGRSAQRQWWRPWLGWGTSSRTIPRCLGLGMLGRVAGGGFFGRELDRCRLFFAWRSPTRGGLAWCRCGRGRRRGRASPQEPRAGGLERLGDRIGGERKNKVRAPAFGAGEGLRQSQPRSREMLPTRTVEVVILFSRLGLRAEQSFRSTQPVGHGRDLMGRVGTRGSRGPPEETEESPSILHTCSELYQSLREGGQPAGRTRGGQTLQLQELSFPHLGSC